MDNILLGADVGFNTKNWYKIYLESKFRNTYTENGYEYVFHIVYAFFMCQRGTKL